MLEAGRNYDAASRKRRCSRRRGEAPLRGVGDAGQAVRLPRRDGRRRLAGAGRALRQRVAGGLGADSTGGARACSAAARITGAASRCATARTTSSRARRDGLGFDWPLALRRPRAVLRQGRDADRRLRRERRAGEHAGLAAGRACCRRRSRASSDLLVAAAREAARHSRRRRSPRRAHAAARSPDTCRRSSIPGNAKAQTHPGRRRCAARAACFWATPCGRGCSIRANYQSTTVHLPPALATGNLDIVAERDGARGHARRGRPGDAASLTSTRRPASRTT